MIFNSWLFGLFGVIVYLLYWFAIPRNWRPAFLMLAGLIFYAASIPAYTILIVALGAVTYGVGRWLLALRPDATVARRWALTVGVVACVGVLAFFKYTKLFAGTFEGLCKHGCTHVLPDIIVPLAISFFTFEYVHVLVDVYKGKITALGARDFWLFSLFFPTMVAGPIKRYQNFVPQIETMLARRRIDPILFATGVFRIALGLAKKAIVADSMNPLVAPLLAPGPTFTHADYWIGALAYAVKIYFDFSGYSDIAIGCALLLGFEILENFDRPYWSGNISIFWRRWHISLSSWIRDYVFIPLGGSRRGKVVALINLTFVMAVAGPWHGAAWHFVAWGLWHGTGLGLHRVWELTI
ncbi:MAG: MBOAT family protein, partial [Candidatus Eremiobacteraeota bacterium]|nr:MBOAT family protein [Candidatus Eremiobacteraeota bacterium]